MLHVRVDRVTGQAERGRDRETERQRDRETKRKSEREGESPPAPYDSYLFLYVGTGLCTSV